MKPRLIRNENLRAGIDVAVMGLEEFACVPRLIIGIDPGWVNFGCALIIDQLAYAYQLHLPGNIGTVERIVGVMQVIQECFDYMGMDKARKEFGLPPQACVEQAAYNRLYGQAPLAEARTAAIMALLKANVNQIEVVNPGAIRKVVFGNGKTRAEDEWPGVVTKDAASALACALYAASFVRKPTP